MLTCAARGDGGITNGYICIVFMHDAGGDAVQLCIQRCRKEGGVRCGDGSRSPVVVRSFSFDAFLVPRITCNSDGLM